MSEELDYYKKEHVRLLIENVRLKGTVRECMQLLSDALPLVAKVNRERRIKERKANGNTYGF